MATTVSSMRPILSREINVPGFEQLPDITNSEILVLTSPGNPLWLHPR